MKYPVTVTLERTVYATVTIYLDEDEDDVLTRARDAAEILGAWEPERSGDRLVSMTRMVPE